MHILPSPLLALLYLSFTSASASPSPPLIDSDFALSLMPRNTLFYRQMKDLQTFSGALGGVSASSIMNSGIPDRPFQVEGNNFPDFGSAAQRSCDEQFQGCQEVANRAGNGGGKRRKRDENDNDGSNGGDGDNDNGNNNNGDNNNGSDGNGGNGGRDAKGKGRGRGRAEAESLTVNMCDQQKEQCNQAQQVAQVQDFQTPVASENIGPDPLFPDFDLICEG